MPKSYLSSQPAAARALRLNFDPYLQVQKRLGAFYDNGHEPQKIDLRILGGTWSYYPKAYQAWFIKRIYQAMNEYERILPLPEGKGAEILCQSTGQRPVATEAIPFGRGEYPSPFNLKNLQKTNETAEHKCIGMSVETRPDYIMLEEIKRLRKFGITKVEIGVQSLNNKILDQVKRGHHAKDVIKATRLLKDAGFKVAYHMMPNLPGETPKGDLENFKELFENPDFKPDYLKIYPCVVLKNSELYKEWKQGRHKPYTEHALNELLISIKKLVPKYTRIERIFRDIPSNLIEAGNKITNYREFLKKDSQCVCIRCREVGANKLEKPVLFDEKYQASGGLEHFISYESPSQNRLYAFARLRFPSNNHKEQIKLLKNTALIRELHTYGQLVPVGAVKNATQHQGLGKKLLAKAEALAKKEGCKKIAVIAGVGVRGYYKKLGYYLDKEFGYMIKQVVSNK